MLHLPLVFCRLFSMNYFVPPSGHKYSPNLISRSHSDKNLSPLHFRSIVRNRSVVAYLLFQWTVPFFSSMIQLTWLYKVMGSVLPDRNVLGITHFSCCL